MQVAALYPTETKESLCERTSAEAQDPELAALYHPRDTSPRATAVRQTGPPRTPPVPQHQRGDTVSAQLSDQPHNNEPLFPMPPITEAALRVAVRRLDLVEAARFDREFHEAWQEAVQTDSTVPMHTFLRKWAEYVALHRYPARSARLRELEHAFQAADTDAEIHEVGDEIARLLAVAGAEVAG